MILFGKINILCICIALIHGQGLLDKVSSIAQLPAPINSNPLSIKTKKPSCPCVQQTINPIIALPQITLTSPQSSCPTLKTPPVLEQIFALPNPIGQPISVPIQPQPTFVHDPVAPPVLTPNPIGQLLSFPTQLNTNGTFPSMTRKRLIKSGKMNQMQNILNSLMQEFSSADSDSDSQSEYEYYYEYIN